MRINNVLLGIFILVSFVDSVFYSRTMRLKNILFIAWPVVVLFVLSVIASFYNWEPGGYKFLEKYWSLLLVPLVVLSDQIGFNQRRRNIFLSLVWGCVATVAICYGNLIWEMVAGGEPVNYFFRWRHIGHQFTEIADTHPTYLGLFVVTSILFLIQDKSMLLSIKYPIFLFLILGLFQLASRMAILLFILIFLFVVINRIKHYRHQIILLILGFITFTALFVILGSPYMKDRMFSIEAITDDKRVQRWQVSYQIFKENPYLGVGYANVKQLRKEKYIENDFTLAATSELNAHNQFLEYLSTNGALGGLIFVVSLGYLLLLSIIRRDHLFTFIFFAFILANITESMMVRIKGIEFFAIFTSLFLCFNLVKDK